MIKVTFPNGDVKEYENGITPLQIAESISPRLAQDVLAASVNDEEWDLSRPLEGDGSIKLFKLNLEVLHESIIIRYFYSRILLTV